ncbi:hypothetical protein JOF56_002248 [Kibdelosporangium banguiense]|uniref:Glycoprotein n=1 Tax=Kibdelosporangium banguiense TaxID=1365924 RepID=A0ABS4TDC9_9PSEU|nr:hypothetical protein [Kibdelosporangium banguiense]MBP2321863.1 hypothetical protein [Kibdelosporangium banguiense]
MSGLRYATRHKSPLAALVTGFLLVLGTPLAAAGQPPPGVEPLVAPIGMARAQPANAPSRVQLAIDQLNPRVVRADSGNVTVSGKLTNVGDRRLEDVEIRLQRGDVLTDEAKLRAALTQPPAAEKVPSPFVEVAKSLDQGASANFTVTVPLDALKLDQPGVYPVLINVNGRPDFGGQERLAGLNVLLPVLSTPSRTIQPPASPSKITVLWPLVDDRPRTVKSTSDGRLVLGDDDLATSLQIGGRLYGMLNAVEGAVRQDSALASSICFAVDGDLLTTVQGMANGYEVQSSNGQNLPGKGQGFAQRWLTLLKSLTDDQCVIALPYADADLSALSRATEVDLAKTAVSQSFTAVSDILKPAKPLQNVVWPIDGVLDPRTLSDITESSPTTVLSNPDRLAGVTGSAPFTVGQSNRAVPIDQLTSSALTGSAAAPGPVSVQNGLAALVFRATQSGQSVLVAPPRRWTAPASELLEYLRSIGRMFAENLADPRPLQDLTSSSANGTASGLNYTEQDVAAEIPAVMTAEIAQTNAVLRDLRGAMEPDRTRPINPDDLLKPIRIGLLRASSSAWRSNVDGGMGAAAVARTELDTMRMQVTVNPPGPPISLASSDSPIPIRVGNNLAVAVKVRLVVSQTAGLRPGATIERTIPAGQAFTDFVPAELQRAGRFTVDVWVTTPGGTALGTVYRFELSSTSYGTITVAVTSVAGGMLMLLAGRRVYRRIKQKNQTEQESTPA